MNKQQVNRFDRLKRQVGGNREKESFEFTFGQSVEEAHGITPLPLHVRRIFSQLQFALGLSQARGGIYDGQTGAALALLEAAVAAQGTITADDSIRAEAALLPLAQDAAQYEVIFASHAHIDMNWMWGWQETVAVTLSTFRTILNLMGEYPTFTFSQSQASVYKIVEEFDPPMMEEIRARIAEGRWEVTANAWVETDKNMPDTESLLRHISLTRDYLRDTWGVDPDSLKVDFSPDTFGHSRFVPEINRFSGVPYYYHCRGLQDDLTLYRFRAPSGAEVLAYKEPYWYNSSPCPDCGTGVFELERRCGGLKTSLIVYGVGDHGGGPTRRDIETVLEMAQWPVFPRMRFGTIHEFFARAEEVRDRLPLVDHELNAIFTGCYTTQSRIKLANRRTEAALLTAESCDALARSLLGSPSAQPRLDRAWQGVLFTHFHDILTGSCVQESREHAMGRLADSLAQAQSVQARALERLSQAVDSSPFAVDGDFASSQSEGAGVGFGLPAYAGVPNPERGKGRTRLYTLFNPGWTPREEPVELTLWDYPGSLSRLEAVDHEGRVLPLELLDPQPVKYWDHKYVRVLVHAALGSWGYRVIALRERELEEYPTFLLHAEREELPMEALVLENEHLTARFDTGSGQLISLVDRASGLEQLSAPAGLTLVRTADGGMSAWRIGRYLGMEPVTGTVSVREHTGPLRRSITFSQKVMDSTLELTVSLDRGARELKYDMEIHWNERRDRQDYIPLLTFRAPLARAGEGLLCDVPAGSAVRSARQMDVPALSFACPVTGGDTVALITDCKYGYRLADGVLSVSLINTAGNPDPYPERGVHRIRLWLALASDCPQQLRETARRLITPALAVPTARHGGALGTAGELIALEAPGCTVSSLAWREDALVLRLFAGEGAPAPVRLRAPFDPASVTLQGRGEGLAWEGRCVRFTAAPGSICQLTLKPLEG